MIRALRAARRSAVKARAQAANQLKAMLITAPEGLKSELYARSLHGQAGYEGFAVSAGDEPLGRANSHQVVRAALGGAPLPAAL